ncbi:hypothetical protein [Inhella proteolytica]|uniref:Uncharacterized protein n=1 Tax=Inhella proteolytica TaxID=2795029 RepID=A0A931J362_9BURK|nr:hypothetical protein [Inhella proteolytica]MBH9578706.1 hypothetical protein [Inhella proteolytica]
MNIPTPHQALDLTALPTGVPHFSAVFDAYRQMRVGSTLEVQSSSELNSLHRHLTGVLDEDFLWTPLPAEAGTLRAQITKLEAFHVCCGACG